MTFSRFRFPAMLAVLALGLTLAACNDDSNGNGDDSAADSDDPIHAISTTTWLHDAVSSVGGDLVEAESLMGPGVDPHDYVTTEGDLTRMERADIIFYNGHHLEGAMSNVLGQVDQRSRTLAVAEQIDDSLLLEPDHDLLGDDFDAPYDPHIWFDIDLWKLATEIIRDEFIDLDPDNEDTYRENADAYMAELDELETYILDRIDEIPEEQRVLITAHDAFGYFGRAFGMEVRGLQPLTTDVEAAASDIRELADIIVEREIQAIFLETAVPPQGIEAVQAAVIDRGVDIEIADDPLYGDALGEEGSEGGTYVGALRFNTDTIVDALTNN
jgi:manganese/zinc/iron transport system substrate-binding protein